MTNISVKNIVKSFKNGNERQIVLNNISLDVEKGDFVSIMGPSGCGKSTLLYLLGGLDKEDKGQIYINGKDITKLSEFQKGKLRRRELGFIFQFYNLIPNLTVEDNIMLPLTLDHKKTRDFQRELEELLEITELTSKKKMYPRELSGGQQQRVAIARSLIFHPDIILADEPIGNLDSKTGTNIMGLFKHINSELNTTIVQVTHSEESAQYGNRIVRMKDGVFRGDERLG